MPKLTPEEQGQLLLDLALDAKLERVGKMTSEEIRARAAKNGMNLLEADEEFDRLLAQADAEQKGAATEKVVRLEDRKKARSWMQRWGTPLAIAAGIAMMVTFVKKSGLFPDVEPTGHAPDDIAALKKANAIREEAYRLADEHKWADCLAKLDEAKALDPEYDQTKRVQDLRRTVERALANDAGD